MWSNFIEHEQAYDSSCRWLPNVFVVALDNENIRPLFNTSSNVDFYRQDTMFLQFRPLVFDV